MAANIIPNLIKQPAQCCVLCGKSYKKRSNLQKHILLCELIHKAKTQKRMDEDEPIPSQRQMFQIIFDLANKCDMLEKKVDELNKWVIKKKKKINVVDWLSSNIIPQYEIDKLIDTITVTYEDISYLLQNNVFDTIQSIFNKSIYISSTLTPHPLFAFAQKSNAFYVYIHSAWTDWTREDMTSFLNQVHMKLYRIYIQYKKTNSYRIQEDETFSLLCDKTTIKMTAIDFRQDTTFNKYRASMYANMKVNMQCLIEPEFEF
jgi:hypothetical protein